MVTPRRSCVAVFVVFAVSTCALARAAADFDAIPGALPKNVVPIQYDIAVAPDLERMTIAGHETIALDVRRPTARIVLNALQTSITAATLDGVRYRTIAMGPQTATLTWRGNLARGRHVLRIAYTATLQTSAQGLFVQKYVDQSTGKPARMLGTQFESTDARRMFPSFDEPAFRARFRLTATVPAAWTAVSNMPIRTSVAAGPGRKRVSFAVTPSMPTYLLVLCAGDFDVLAGSAGRTAIHVYAPRGTGAELTYARDSLERLVPYFASYYGIAYPLPKIDLISIPQFFGGAMENWGGMTFTDTSVVYDPANETPSARHDIFDVIAHETSHQWNGDLVTMAWWDQLWLNEGFATWMESKSTAELNPTWNWWLKFDAATDGALISDSRKSTTRVAVPVHNETEANTVFDPDIAYQKPGAFLRMMEAYLGKPVFQEGLHQYFIANAFRNSTASDLWRALSSASHRDFEKIADAWIDAPGFPLVGVTASCDGNVRTLQLRQQRYATFADTSTTVWSIPLEIDDGGAAPTPFLFDAASATIPGGSCDAPLNLNAGYLGYYRVAYDPAQQELQRAHFTTLPVEERLSLLNDSYTFATDGKAKLSEFLAYVRADTGDADVHVATTIVNAFRALGQAEFGRPGEAAFKRYEIGYLTPLLAALGGWDGPTNDVDASDLRLAVLRALASADDPATIAEARKRFAAAQTDPKNLGSALKAVVLEIVGRSATPQDYDVLIADAGKSNNPVEVQTYYSAAFGAKDPALARRSLEAALTLPPQYSSLAPVVVAIVGNDNPAMAWDFMKANDAKLFGSLSEFDRIPYETGISEVFWRTIPFADIEAYLRGSLPKAASPQVDKAMETIGRLNDARTRLVPQLDAVTGATGGT